MKMPCRILIFLLFSFLTISQAEGYTSDLIGPGIQGTWLGELEIPNQGKIRLGIIISPNDDNTLKAVLNIIDQATGNIPCDEIIYRNDSVTIRLKNLGIEICGPVDETGNNINCKFKQRGGVLSVAFTRVEKLPELSRPQEPVAPFPYKIEEVVFENKKASVKFSGTITFPEKPGRYPAVIMVTGSGKQDRNEEFAKHKPFWVIADYLTRRGIVVLRYDERGSGKSTGNFDRASTGDFADDAIAAISFLKTRNEVNQMKVGILGHSEGGIVASVVANEMSDVAFIVSLAGFVINFEDVILGQLINQAKLQGKSDEDIELEKKWRKSLYSIVKEKTDSATAAEKMWAAYSRLTEDEIKRLNWPKGRQESQIKQLLNPWWKYNLSLDNRKTIMNIKCPVLALYGELDKQVDPGENVPFVEEALKNGNCKNYRVVKLPGKNHMFQTAQTGSEYEYVRIEETISPEALELIATWIGKTAGVK